MIVPMKKISLVIRGDKKSDTLKTLRKLGLVHIEISEGFGEKLTKLHEQISLLESAGFILGKPKNQEQMAADTDTVLSAAADITALDEKIKRCHADRAAAEAELDRLKTWGELDPDSLRKLAAKGVDLSPYEMPKAEYAALPDSLKVIKLAEGKASVRFVLIGTGADEAGQDTAALSTYRFELPDKSVQQLRESVSALTEKADALKKELASYACYADSMKKAVKVLEKEVEFETYATGMAEEELSPDDSRSLSVACFTGYIEAEHLDVLKQTAKENCWGLLVQDPCEEDNVPSKLKNNRFVSLIYPLTDFLGTVPGYFEYDISGWFLAFILIFFGIIFGDGGYGLLICAVAAALIGKSLLSKKKIEPTILLIGLFGLSTVLWGTLTCTWFGLPAEQLPVWLQKLSVPVISNVYADKIWSLPWTADGKGLTTAQNLQILCFTLALVQLTVAHIKGALRNKGSLKMLGDIGSILQLFGIYYLVLSLVVNAEVFSFGLVVGGIPVGTVSLALVGVGFVLSFVFSNYEGDIVKSLLASLTNIVSVLLGVVNVFSDIVSYIRLWAVGLAGAAISATVNELAGPLFGNFMFMILAIALLVFGHGLNMILNVLSVIVHGIRLNTLEFSSHLDMSWSGHKFNPFKEQID